MSLWIRTYVRGGEGEVIRESLIKKGKESFLTLRGW